MKYQRYKDGCERFQLMIPKHMIDFVRKESAKRKVSFSKFIVDSLKDIYVCINLKK